MRVGEGIARIESLYNRGTPPSSSRLKSRHVYNMIKTARALVAKQSLKQGSWSYSTLSCVRMRRVAASECGCSESFGVWFHRSEDKIPTPIKGDNYLLSVLTPDNTIEFSQTTWEAARYNQNSRFAKRVPQYYIKDGYLFAICPMNIGTLVLNGVWFDPVEAAMFESRFTDECISAQDVSLGLDSDLWAQVYEIVMQELGIFVNMEEDGTQDSKDRPNK